MQVFTQLSDPHLTSLVGVRWHQLLNKRVLGYLSWRRKRRHEHRPAVLAALAADLAAEDPGLLLVTGDLTHVGLPQEFREARAWLETLGGPERVAVVPGNHDAYAPGRWDQTYAQWQDYMAGDAGEEQGAAAFPSLRVRGELAFIGLSSACPTAPLLATGTLGDSQRRRLAEVLAETARRGLFRVVYLHHPLLPGEEKWRKRLTDAPALRELLYEAGAELVLHGHGHRARIGEVATAAGPAPVIAVPSASALGNYGADVAAYNRYRVERTAEGWRLQVLPRRYDTAQGGFRAGSALALDLPRRG
jgi:3',5'-cyclic AMP phosphodiesterase CpdA